MATQPDRGELAKQFQRSVAPKLAPEEPKAVPTRSQIVDGLFSGQAGQQTRENLFGQTSQPRKVSFTKPAAPIVAPQWEQKKGGGGFGGFLGDVIGIIDTPRAFVVSTVKETGDLLRGDGFDFGDWWNQTADNMMMGEVFRDWGVDLPGPLDFIVGIGFDIALDPLTYLTGGAAAARQLTGKQVATAFTQAAKAADKAGDAVAYKKYTDAAAKASTRGILSVGDDALRDIGLSAGLGFTVPGTGRLGRRIVEGPLRRVSQKFGGKLDARRVSQLPESKLPGRFNPWPAADEAIDVAKHQDEIVEAMRRMRAGETLGDYAKYESYARRAKAMPVQSKLRIPGTGKFVEVVAGTPGRAFGTVASTALGRYIAKGLSPDASLNQKFRAAGKKVLGAGDDASRRTAMDELVAAAKLSEARDTALVKVGIAEHKGLDMLGVLKAQADELNVDFDQLMLFAAEQPRNAQSILGLPDQFGSLNSALRELDPRYLDDPKVAALHGQAQTFWKQLGDEYNKILGDVGVDFKLIEDEFYVARFLAGEAPVGSGNQVLTGSSVNRRMYRTDKGIRQVFKEGLITDEAILEAAAASKVAVKDAEGTARGIDAIFSDVLSNGGSFNLTGGGKVTNLYLDSPLLGKAGGVRAQMKDIGEKLLGPKYYDQYATDAADVISRYMNVMNKHVRIQYMLGYMDEAGVTAKGMTRGGFGQAVDDAARTVNRNESTLRTRWEKDLVRKSELELKAERHAARVTELQERVVAAARGAGREAGPVGPIDLAALPKWVQQKLRQMEDLSLQISDTESIVSNLRNVKARIGAGEFDAIDGLSPAAFDLLRNPSNAASNRAVGAVGKAITREAQEEATQFIYNMAERVQAMQAVRNQVIKLTQSGDELTMAGAGTLLNDIDAAIRESEEIIRSLNRNYVDALFQDPTVVAAQKLDDLADAFSESSLGRGSKVLDPFGNVVPDQSLDDFISEVKRLYKQAGRRKGVPYEAVKRYDKFFDDLKAYKKLADDLDPETLYASIISQSIKNLPEAKTAIRELAGIDVIADEIAKVKASLASIEGDQFVLFRNQDQVNELNERLALLEARAAEKEALIQPMQDMLDDYYETIVGPAQREIGVEAGRMSEAAGEASRIGKEFDRQLKVIETQRAVNEAKFAIQRENDPFLSNRLAAITDQQEALKNINTVRGHNGLSDLYGDTLSDFAVELGGFGNAQTKQALRGRYLLGGTEEFAESYADMFQSLARLQDPETIGAFAQRYNTFLNYWKAQAVSTPGFFMRNMMGGAWINSALNDVPMSTHIRVWEIRKAAMREGKKLAATVDDPNDIIRGLDRLIADGKPVRLGVKAGGSKVSVDELQKFKEWYRTGMAGQGQVSQEVASTLDQFGKSTWKPYKAEFKPFAMIRRRNQDTEFMLRGAMAHHTVMTGRSVDDAYKNVIKYHFDYSDLTNVERKIKKVIPFWVWQKNVVPVLIESMGKKPAAWGRLLQVKKEMELTSPMEGIVPDYFGENMGVRMPFKMGGNRVYVLPDLPFRDLAKFTKDVENPLDAKQVGKNVWRVARESALPPIKFPIEHWAGKQTFADIPLTGRFQQAPKWAEIPGLKQALLVTGLAKQSKGTGRLVMTDKNIYGFDQFLPMFGRLRRFVPNERKKQEAFWTTAINTSFGTGLRVNTPSEVRSQIYRMQREWANDWQQGKDIEFRSR